MIKTEINAGDFPVNKKIVQNAVDKCSKFLKIKNNTISVAFVSEKEIKKLNKIYRKIDKATDVLSFGNLEKQGIRLTKDANSEQTNHYAEIVISYEQAKKQSRENKIEINKEIETLIIHSFLHLLGFDHENDKDADEMELLEMQIRGCKNKKNIVI